MESASSLDEPPAGAVVRAFDETSEPDAGRDRLETERWEGLAAAVLCEEGVSAGELGLRFVDPSVMAELNLTHMGAPGPTDVLAFPIDGGSTPAHPSEPAPLLGDVVVCPAYAAAQAPDHGGTNGSSFAERHERQPHSLAEPEDRQQHSLADELALLVVHGVLHVLGYDHLHDTDAAAMRAREQQLLAAHHRQP